MWVDPGSRVRGVAAKDVLQLGLHDGTGALRGLTSLTVKIAPKKSGSSRIAVTCVPSSNMTVRATALVLCSIAACAEKVSPRVDAPPAVVDAPPDAVPLANIPDDGFGTHGSVAFAATCQAFALDASDRSLVVTQTDTQNTTPLTLSRYTTAGTLDQTFGTGGNVAVSSTVGSPSFTVFTLASGKIVVLGRVYSDATHFAPHVYRFTSDGTLDLDIELPATMDPRAVVAHERADGELELVTWGTSSAFDVVRITAAGALDSAFGSNGVVAIDTGTAAGYFPHGVAVADGTFILSGATFGQAPGMGVGPVNGHLFRVVDGTVTANVQTDNAQYLSVVTDGVQPFVLVNSLPDQRATIAAIDATTLKYDPGTGLTLPFPITANYGTFSGAALSIRSGTDLFVNMPDMTTTMLARYREDNAHEPGGYGTVADHSGYCGSALDSQTRPVFATQTTLYRFTP